MINKSTMLFVSVVLFVYCFDGRTVFAPTEYFIFFGRCWFVNDVLQIWERKKNLFRGTPIKRPHREVIVLALANSELLLEIMKGKELV